MHDAKCGYIVVNDALVGPVFIQSSAYGSEKNYVKLMLQLDRTLSILLPPPQIIYSPLTSKYVFPSLSTNTISTEYMYTYVRICSVRRRSWLFVKFLIVVMCLLNEISSTATVTVSYVVSFRLWAACSMKCCR